MSYGGGDDNKTCPICQDYLQHKQGGPNSKIPGKWFWACGNGCKGKGTFIMDDGGAGRGGGGGGRGNFQGQNRQFNQPRPNGPFGNNGGFGAQGQGQAGRGQGRPSYQDSQQDEGSFGQYEQPPQHQPQNKRPRVEEEEDDDGYRAAARVQREALREQLGRDLPTVLQKLEENKETQIELMKVIREQTKQIHIFMEATSNALQKPS
jgi:hypothetical protein